MIAILIVDCDFTTYLVLLTQDCSSCELHRCNKFILKPYFYVCFVPFKLRSTLVYKIT